MNSVLRGGVAPILRILLVMLAVVGTSACFGDDDADEADTETARGEEAREAEAVGTLQLGSETIEFVVDACDLAAEPTGGRPTLTGHANLPDDRTLQITMLRTPMGTTTWQSVALDFGTDYREARRGRSEGEEGWRPILADSTESGLGPLITVDGRTVAAEGTFLPGSGGASEPVQGSVTATCPES